MGMMPVHHPTAQLLRSAEQLPRILSRQRIVLAWVALARAMPSERVSLGERPKRLGGGAAPKASGVLQHADGHVTVIGGEANGEALSVGEGGEFGRGGCWLTLACHRWLAVEDKAGLAISLVVLKADVGLVAGRLDARDAAAVGLDDACAEQRRR